MTDTSIVSGNPLAECPLCGYSGHSLVQHMLSEHGDKSRAHWNVETLFSQDVRHQVNGSRIEPSRTDPTVLFAGQRYNVNLHVPSHDCLPLPSFYRVPQYGALSTAVQEVSIAIRNGRSTYVDGPPGCGKDAFFYAYSAKTRTPALKFQVIPGTDIQPWFFSRALNREGSFWEEGTLLQAVRDGYTAPDGSKLPYMILITDWDRASRTQAEWLRMVLDSIEGRVPGPKGITFPVLPGTLVVATGNTAGGGDPKARMVSANPMDASMQERWERSFHFDWLDWRDEMPVLRRKFPIFARRCGEYLEQENGESSVLQKVTESIREAIGADRLYMEFSHRYLCSWLGHAEDILSGIDEAEDVPTDLLKRSAQAFLTRVADPYTRQACINLMGVHIPGGMMDGKDKEETP